MRRKHVALLRGVNVGRANRVAMADLRLWLTDLGFAEVHTVLNSGNVIFEAEGLDAARIADVVSQMLADRLGFPVRVIVLTASAFAAVVAENSLAGIAANPSRLLVALLDSPGAQSRLEPLTRQDWSPEAIALGDGAAYLWCPAGTIASPLVRAVNRTLGAFTTRNWATVTKIDSLLH
jgi:uncharacterized protein (DUF1697 family)